MSEKLKEAKSDVVPLPRPCVDCLFHNGVVKPTDNFVSAHLCIHPSLRKFDVVTGWAIIPVRCVSMRERACGYEGHLFEPKGAE